MTRLQYLLREAFVGVGIVAVAACGDDGPVDETPGPDFALTVTPAVLLTVAGASNSGTVTINRTNFTDEVTLELLNPPAGISAVFDPTPVSAGTSALVVRAAEATVPGEYQLTIQGTAAGPGVRTATLTVTVPDWPAGDEVAYLFCDPDDVPDYFAYQDGTGTWRTVTGVANGAVTSYPFALSQGYGGVLMVFREEAAVRAASRNAGRMTNLLKTDPGRSGPLSQLRASTGTSTAALAEVYYTWLLYGSGAELALDGLVACAQDPPAKTVSGNVIGVSPGAYGIVSVGYITKIFDGAASSNPMTFADVPGGPVDLIASRTTPGNTPDRILLARNLSLLDGGTLPADINYTGSGSSAPATAAATVTGGAGDDLEIFVDLVTANGQAGLWFDLSPSPDANRVWAGLSPTVMQSSDLHGLFVFASASDGSGDLRHAIKYVGPVEDQTLTLGPVINPLASSQVDGGTYPRFRFQNALPAEYDKRLTIDVFGPGLGNGYSILATGAWLDAAGSLGAFDITMPDVAGLAGFPAAARLTPGTNDVVVSAAGWVNGPGIFDLRPTLGAEHKESTRYGTITVP